MRMVMGLHNDRGFLPSMDIVPLLSGLLLTLRANINFLRTFAGHSTPHNCSNNQPLVCQRIHLPPPLRILLWRCLRDILWEGHS